MALTIRGSSRDSTRIVEGGYGANKASSLLGSEIFAWSKAAWSVNWTAHLNRVCRVTIRGALLYLYRARNKIPQLSIPTHAQLQRHRLKFI